MHDLHSVISSVFQTMHFTDGSISDTTASVIQVIPFQPRNYYKSVSENKEIVKLVSVLSAAITSTKKVHDIQHVCTCTVVFKKVCCCVHNSSVFKKVHKS